MTQSLGDKVRKLSVLVDIYHIEAPMICWSLQMIFAALCFVDEAFIIPVVAMTLIGIAVTAYVVRADRLASERYLETLLRLAGPDLEQKLNGEWIVYRLMIDEERISRRRAVEIYRHIVHGNKSHVMIVEAKHGEQWRGDKDTV